MNKCDHCGKPVEKSALKNIPIHEKCLKQVGKFDYGHFLRHTIWPRMK